MHYLKTIRLTHRFHEQYILPNRELWIDKQIIILYHFIDMLILGEKENRRIYGKKEDKKKKI